MPLDFDSEAFPTVQILTTRVSQLKKVIRKFDESCHAAGREIAQKDSVIFLITTSLESKLRKSVDGIVAAHSKLQAELQQSIPSWVAEKWVSRAEWDERPTCGKPYPPNLAQQSVR